MEKISLPQHFHICFSFCGNNMSAENPSSPERHPAKRFDQLSGTHKTQVQQSVSPPIPRPDPNMPAELQRAMEEARQQQRKAREQAIQRYQPASTAYLTAILKNSDRATEVWEGVIDKWLAGKLSGYDPQQSFRKYLKSVLRNAVFTFSRNRRQAAERAMLRLEEEYEIPDSQEAVASRAFDKRLQDDLLKHTLAVIREDNPQHFEVIQRIMQAVATNSDPPDSRTLAEVLSRISGKPVTEESARQIKSRARERFPRELIRQTQLMIASDDLDRVEETLADLEMLAYCEKTLQKMRKDRGKDGGQPS